MPANIIQRIHNMLTENQEKVKSKLEIVFKGVFEKALTETSKNHSVKGLFEKCLN